MVTDLVKKGIVGIVFILIVITVIGATASIVDDSAEDITFDDRCNTLSTCIYNETADATAPCRDSTNQSNACTTSIDGEYPLGSLFNTGGVIILAFLGAGFIALIGLVLKKWGKQ